MFKNRKITVTVDKKNVEQTPEITRDPEEFEKRMTFVVQKIERIGVKVFAGVCLLVLLDTHRQVAVAKATHPTE